MALNIKQIYDTQGIIVNYQDHRNRILQQNRQINAEPVFQQHRTDRDQTMQQQIYGENHSLQHMQIYEEDFQIHAQICPSEYTQKDTICTEIQQEEQPLQFATQAQVRDNHKKTYKSKSILSAKYAEHIGENDHICDVCHKGFPYKSLLKSHYLRHIEQKPHVCEVCNKGFKHKGDLVKHSLTHTGKKPHVCNICQQGFVQKATMKRHQLSHFGVKNLICDLCNKHFARKDNFRTHYLKHLTDEVGKQGKGKSKKNAVDKKHEDHIPIPIAKTEAFLQDGKELFHQEIEMNPQVIHAQTEPGLCDVYFECDIYFEDNSGSLKTVDQQINALLFEHQVQQQIQNHTLAQIGHETFTINDQQP